MTYTSWGFSERLTNLEILTDDSTFSRALKEGASAACEIIQKYYQPACKSPVYAVATAMDPRARYQWWVGAEWNPSAIDDATESVVRAWSAVRSTATQQQTHTVRNNFVFQIHGLEDEDELEQYVKGKRCRDTIGFSELHFWKGVEYDGSYKNLAPVARKYLAVCASSAPSERAFSLAKLFMPDVRNSLSPQALKETVILSSLRRHWEKTS
jgi:hypothetical protein